MLASLQLRLRLQLRIGLFIWKRVETGAEGRGRARGMVQRAHLICLLCRHPLGFHRGQEEWQSTTKQFAYSAQTLHKLQQQQIQLRQFHQIDLMANIRARRYPAPKMNWIIPIKWLSCSQILFSHKYFIVSFILINHSTIDNLCRVLLLPSIFNSCFSHAIQTHFSPALSYGNEQRSGLLLATQIRETTYCLGKSISYRYVNDKQSKKPLNKLMRIDTFM